MMKILFHQEASVAADHQEAHCGPVPLQWFIPLCILHPSRHCHHQSSLIIIIVIVTKETITVQPETEEHSSLPLLSPARSSSWSSWLLESKSLHYQGWPLTSDHANICGIFDILYRGQPSSDRPQKWSLSKNKFPSQNMTSWDFSQFLTRNRKCYVTFGFPPSCWPGKIHFLGNGQQIILLNRGWRRGKGGRGAEPNGVG